MPVDQTVFGIEHLDAFASSDVIVFDTETTGLRPEVGGLRLIQVAAKGCPVVVVDYWKLDDAGVSALRSFFEARPRKWYAHNATFDLGWLQEHSIYPNGHVYCTMLASRLLENGVPNARHGLAAAAKRYLDVDVSKEEQRSDWSAPALSESQMAYAANDVRILLELIGVICQRIKVARLDSAWALECKALAPIAHMQRIGLPFNRQKLIELQQSYEAQITDLGAKFVEELDQAMPKSEKLPRDPDGSFNLRAKPSGSIREGTKLMAGFNLNSPAQLVKKFTALLGQPPIDEKTQKPSASTGALRSYAADHSVIQLYLAWKKAEKRRQMVSALLEHQADDGFIRANYMQLGADTGRMSCVAGDTVLITSRGDFTFEDYLPQVGDLVLTHVGRWMPVVRKLYRGVEPVFEVVTAEGGVLCCTSDHKLWTGADWVRISDLSVGDSLGLFKEVGSAAGERGRRSQRVPQRTASNGLPSGRHGWNELQQCDTGFEGAPFSREAQSGKGTSPVKGQSGISKPYVGQEWFPAPQLCGGSGGSQGVLDGAGWERGSNLSAPFGDGTGSRAGAAPSQVGSASHRWGYSKQLPGQSGLGNEEGTCCLTPSTTVVESIKPLGPVGVWDIEVEEDHSYALYGFLSHNCREPNLQQVPRDKGFRAAAEAPEGWAFVCADFGQMELRLAAAVSEDERMIQAFQQGEDLHTITAAAIYPEPTEDPGELKARRQVAKSANFGLLFGSGAKGLRNYAGAMGITMTIEEADQIRETFHATYQGIHRWQQVNADAANKTAREKWPEVRIPQSDMRRFLLGEMNRLTTRCNTPIQGAGAAILKLGLGRLWPHIKEAGEDAVRLCAVVHDEVLLLVREGTEEEWAKRLSEELEQAESMWLGPIPPLAEAAWGKTWADAK